MTTKARHLDDSESLLVEHWYSRAQTASRIVEQDEAVYVREYRRGLLSYEEMERLALTIDAMTEVYDEYLDKTTRCVLRRNSRRALVRCRRVRPSLVVEPQRLPVVHSTEVRSLSSLVDRPRVDDSGPHAPPSVVGGPPS